MSNTYEPGALVEVADPVTGVHGMHVVKRQDGDDLIVAKLDRPDIEMRVPVVRVSPYGGA